MQGFSGADCNALVREAQLCCIMPALLALAEAPPGGGGGGGGGVDSGVGAAAGAAHAALSALISMEHFEQALAKIKPSVSESDLKMYDSYAALLAKASGDVVGS